MSDQTPRRRRLLLIGSIVAIFSIGVATGALVTSAAASRAAQVALDGARRLYVSDQEARLAQAWNAGDMNEALAHARCAYEAEFAEGAGWFDTRATGWSIWGGAFVLKDIIEPNAASFASARPIHEGEAHAKIAVVLERLGRPDEASRRLGLATKVGGQDAAWWRGLGLKIVGISLPQGFLHPDGTVHP